MESAQDGACVSVSEEQLFEKLEDYPWYSDEEFQCGLRAILGPDPNPDQEKPLTLRARCFYYSRKYNIQIDFDAYQDWHVRQGYSENMSVNDGVSQVTTLVASRSLDEPENLASNPSEPPAPYPLSFNRIVELITTGQAIPGIKEIPDTVLEGQASQVMHSARKKPWEMRNSPKANDAGHIDDVS